MVVLPATASVSSLHSPVARLYDQDCYPCSYWWKWKWNRNRPRKKAHRRTPPDQSSSAKAVSALGSTTSLTKIGYPGGWPCSAGSELDFAIVIETAMWVDPPKSWPCRPTIGRKITVASSSSSSSSFTLVLLMFMTAQLARLSIHVFLSYA